MAVVINQQRFTLQVLIIWQKMVLGATKVESIEDGQFIRSCSYKNNMVFVLTDGNVQILRENFGLGH